MMVIITNLVNNAPKIGKRWNWELGTGGSRCVGELRDSRNLRVVL